MTLLATGPTVRADDVPGRPDRSDSILHVVAGPQGALSIATAGDGPGSPLVPVHGDSSRASQWDAVRSIVAPSHRMLAVDLRGHGASEPARDGDHGRAARAEDVLAAADGWDRFALVANGGGAGVALALGADHPDRVVGFLMVDPATDPRALPAEVREGFVSDLAGAGSVDAQKACFALLAGADATVRERVLRDAEAVDPAARLGVGWALAG